MGRKCDGNKRESWPTSVARGATGVTFNCPKLHTSKAARSRTACETENVKNLPDVYIISAEPPGSVRFSSSFNCSRKEYLTPLPCRSTPPPTSSARPLSMAPTSSSRRASTTASPPASRSPSASTACTWCASSSSHLPQPPHPSTRLLSLYVSSSHPSSTNTPPPHRPAPAPLPPASATPTSASPRKPTWSRTAR